MPGFVLGAGVTVVTTNRLTNMKVSEKGSATGWCDWEGLWEQGMGNWLGWSGRAALRRVNLAETRELRSQLAKFLGKGVPGRGSSKLKGLCGNKLSMYEEQKEEVRGGRRERGKREEALY